MLSWHCSLIQSSTPLNVYLIFIIYFLPTHSLFRTRSLGTCLRQAFEYFFSLPVHRVRKLVPGPSFDTRLADQEAVIQVATLLHGQFGRQILRIRGRKGTEPDHWSKASQSCGNSLSSATDPARCFGSVPMMLMAY